MKKIDGVGLGLIAEFEGFRTSPYICVGGYPTIGYGFTHYPNGNAVTMNDKMITKSEALDMLKLIVKEYEDCVNRYVRPDISQNQFNSLVSIAYNIGTTRFRSSTLLKVVNDREVHSKIREAFMMWRFANGKDYLKKRRLKEIELYFTPS